MNVHPDFQRFDAATDAAGMRSLLCTGIERAWGVPVEVLSLSVPRAFPRPGGGFTLQYRLELRRGGTEQVTPLVLCAHLRGPGEPWPDYVDRRRDVVICDDTLGLAVPIFPFDPELEVLPDLVSPDRALDLLRQLAGERFEASSLARVEVLGYRLGRRCVLLYQLFGQNRQREPLEAVAKVFRPSRAGGLNRMLQLLGNADAAPLAARIWAADGRRGIQLMERAPGRSLHDLLGSRELESGCDAAGRALRRLHALVPEELPEHSAADTVQELGALVELAARMFPELAERLATVYRALACRQPSPPPQRCCVHRDFYDKQVMHAPDRTTLLDWDNLAAGDPAEDHGNFLAHLALRSEQEPQHAASIERGVQAFRRAYGTEDGRFEAGSRWWQSAALLRLAALYGLRRRWRHLAGDLIRRAGEVLAAPGAGARVGMLLFALLLGASPALAGPPEYMKLKPRVGQTLEIEGKMNEKGVFLATVIEELPQPRRPQLRGSLEAFDAAGPTLTVLRVPIRITEKTESQDPDSMQVPIAKLVVGQRIEVSCEVTESGEWIARRIGTQGLKPSDKIKGTITRAAVDGLPPDTLEISGFRILLDAKTDVPSRLGQGDPLERTLFGELAARDATLAGRGLALASGTLLLQPEYRGHVLATSDLDLSQRFQSDESETLPEFRIAATGYLTGHLRTRAQLRLRRNFVLSSELDREPELEAHLTELYALWKTAGHRRLAVQLGRQDFDEPREWIFDEYLDALRVYAYGQRLVLEGAFVHAVEPIKPSFGTWTDFLAMAKLYLDRKSHFGVWLLARSDSDEKRNRQPVWAGVRYWGRLGRLLRPWADVVLMRGEDKGRRLRAWAVDVGGTLQVFELLWAPSLTAGYAVGSGDGSTADGVDGNFRQTGYEDNWGRFGGVTSLKYYGALLDPELSNLEILTLGAGVRPVPDASLEVVYHSYRQNDGDDRLRSGNLVDPPARPNGASTELGWGVDVLGAAPVLWKVLRVRWTTAFFSPGEAFSPRQEDAVLHKLDLTVAF